MYMRHVSVDSFIRVNNKTIPIRLSYQEKNILAKYAFENDLTVSQIVRSLIRKYLKEIENEESMD